MDPISIAAPDFTSDPADPPGFRSSMFRLGKLVGAERTGISVYELPPGQQVCPYHYEHGEEEWVLVLDGIVELRTPDGTRPLAAWDIVFFPRGPEGAHALANRSDTTARILMFSNVDKIAVATYPDSDKVGVWTDTPEGGGMFRRSSSVEYFDGEGTPLVE